ncbi:MAG: 4Fe-4S dicluster domain-containing protein [Lentisphaerae bacterium]|nr:4Fe-4S dicluster domain-containing protein [Lentisphaerota bacterium]
MPFRLYIDKERCKGCALCVSACVRGVLRMTKQLNARGQHYPEARNPGACTACRRCTAICPDAAIEIEKADASVTDTPAKKES